MKLPNEIRLETPRGVMAGLRGGSVRTDPQPGYGGNSRSDSVPQTSPNDRERNRLAHAESDTNQGSAGHCATFDALM